MFPVLDESWLRECLQMPESDSLDFKKAYTTENSDIVHDILCLANSSSSSHKHLIMGVEDKTAAVVGVEGDPNRKVQAGLMNILYTAKFNRMPSVRLTTIIIDGHEVDVVTILNLPEKPYFLTKDYRSGSKTVRCGVIYTRNGDTNTPIDGTSDDLQIEKMFRERFGIDKPALERATQYLRDVEKWAYGYDNGNLYFYYKPFPEFTLMVAKESEEFSEPWVLEFPDTKASRDELYLKYHSTRLSSLFIIWCDGARLAVVMPRQIALYPNGHGSVEDMYLSYVYIEDSLQLLVQNMINSVYPQTSRFYIDGVIEVFSSAEEAEKELASDLANSAQKYTFYHYDDKERVDIRIDRSGKRKLISR